MSTRTAQASSTFDIPRDFSIWQRFDWRPWSKRYRRQALAAIETLVLEPQQMRNTPPCCPCATVQKPMKTVQRCAQTDNKEPFDKGLQITVEKPELPTLQAEQTTIKGGERSFSAVAKESSKNCNFGHSRTLNLKHDPNGGWQTAFAWVYNWHE